MGRSGRRRQRTGLLQDHLEILEYAVSFLGYGAEQALAGFRIDRNDARNEYVVAGTRGTALRPTELRSHVQTGGGWGTMWRMSTMYFLLQAFGTTPPASRSLGRQRSRRASIRSAMAVSTIIKNIMIKIIEMAPAVLYCVE